MVNIDHQLLHQARLLTTGANIHEMNTHIFLYEQAVRLHNIGHAKHRSYQANYEMRLRKYVRSAMPAKLLQACASAA